MVGGVALVLAIRAAIPGADPEPALARTDAAERAHATPERDEDASSPLTVTPVVTTPDAAGPSAPPETSAPPIVRAEPPQPAQPEANGSAAGNDTVSLIAHDGGAPSVAPGPVVPVEVLRADLDRLRARYEAAATAGGDAGANRSPEDRRSMIALMEGGALLRRLSAGDPAFHDQLNAYRTALHNGGTLDDNARAALRARIFDGAHSDRAALYDEILRTLR